MRVGIFGVGYVGLVQAAALANSGHDVLAVDTDRLKIERLSQGIVPIYEPGLAELISPMLSEGRLAFTTDGAEAIRQSDILFIAVGTPPNPDGSADLRHVLSVARQIGRTTDRDIAVVVKSTVPVGTTEQVRDVILSELRMRGLLQTLVHVASNPEFLKEGTAISDFVRPDRIVIGTDSPRAEALLRELYGSFVANDERFYVMDIRSAELTKYAANSLLAAKISFMNEMAAIADAIGADVEKVRAGISADPRIGSHFLNAGAGYGGSCFPKDVRALVQTAEKAGVDPVILKSVEHRNELQKHVLFQRVSDYFSGDLSDKTIAVWGLSFKPNTNDMRDAPSRVLLEALWNANAKVRAYDPKAMEECRAIYGDRPDMTYCASEYHATEGADALVVVTEWPVFRAANVTRLRRNLKSRAIFDGRNIFDAPIMKEHGLTYVCIGRSMIRKAPAKVIPLKRKRKMAAA